MDKHLQTQCVANWTINFQKAHILCQTNVDRFPKIQAFFKISYENIIGKVKKKKLKLQTK